MVGCSTGSRGSIPFCSTFLGTRFTTLDWGTLQYIDHYWTPFSCLHGGAGAVCEGLSGPLHPPLCMLITLHTYVCRGVLAFICTVVTDVTTGNFWLYWFILHGCSGRSGVRDMSRSAVLQQDLPLSKRYSTVRSCSPTRACTGKLLAVATWQGLVSPYSTHIGEINLFLLPLCKL